MQTRTTDSSYYRLLLQSFLLNQSVACVAFHELLTSSKLTQIMLVNLNHFSKRKSCSLVSFRNVTVFRVQSGWFELIQINFINWYLVECRPNSVVTAGKLKIDFQLSWSQCKKQLCSLSRFSKLLFLFVCLFVLFYFGFFLCVLHYNLQF